MLLGKQWPVGRANFKPTHFVREQIVKKKLSAIHKIIRMVYSGIVPKAEASGGVALLIFSELIGMSPSGLQ
jgi:hypothetical protein